MLRNIYGVINILRKVLCTMLKPLSLNSIRTYYREEQLKIFVNVTRFNFFLSQLPIPTSFLNMCIVILFSLLVVNDNKCQQFYISVKVIVYMRPELYLLKYFCFCRHSPIIVIQRETLLSETIYILLHDVNNCLSFYDLHSLRKKYI